MTQQELHSAIMEVVKALDNAELLPSARVALSRYLSQLINTNTTN